MYEDCKLSLRLSYIIIRSINTLALPAATAETTMPRAVM